MNLTFPQLAANAQRDVRQTVADFYASEAKRRAAIAKAQHEANVKKHAPAWAEQRRAWAIKAVMDEVGNGPVTSEHKAAVDRILGGEK
jgi:hypothetical protein